MAGNITIILPTDNFVKVPRGIVRNDAVDTLALGIFVKVLCIGRETPLTVQDLADRLSISLAKVQKAFAALEDAGYLRRSRVKDASGRFVGWDYEVSSEPFTDTPKNRQSEKPTIGKTDCRKNGSSVPIIYNTNSIKENRSTGNNIDTASNTNTSVIDNNTTSSKIDKKEKKDTVERKEKVSAPFRRPTVQEVAEYCLSRHNGIDAAAFVDFYESKGWLVGRTPMKDWKAAVRTWEQRQGPQQHKPQQSLGDYYTDLVREIKQFYGTDTPDEQ